jgi:hypothetical protein
MRKSSFFSLYLFALLALTLTSCDVVAGIFKAGMWTTLILILLGVGLVVWLFSRFSGRR